MAKKDNTEDKIVAVEEALGRTEQFIETNQKYIMIVLAAIILVVLGYLGYTKLYIAPREAKAQSEVFMAEKYFESDSLDMALNGDGNYMGFLEIIDNYGSTKTGNLANYYAGMCYLKKGEFQQAIKYLEDFSSDELMVSSMATGAMGDAYLELGNNEKAISCYTKAAENKPNEFTSPVFYMKAGLTYELKGDFDNALKMYETIKTKYPRSLEGRDIEKYIVKATELSTSKN
ncbi:MAG: tetratricopeptide repeat protein [Bacteroidetes bacterium HGW-Bacteroidetes-22]|nr:MAG: tetratricopeptide repeat protein [Bacteroidetes bacterium HGW-Bacteroidetes-22]